METASLSLVEFTVWLLRVSAQTSVVIGLVLVAQWLFQKKLSPRWRYCLWSLVLIRLMLPVSPGSAFSIFNYTQGVNILARGTGVSPASLADRSGLRPDPAVAVQVAPPSAPNPDSSHLLPTESADRAAAGLPTETNQLAIAPASPLAIPLVSTAVPSTLNERDTAGSEAIGPPLTASLSPSDLPASDSGKAGGESAPAGRKREVAPRSTLPPLHVWLSLLWLGGVLFLLTRIIWFPLRLNAQLAQHETATGPAVFEILEQSKRLMGMRKVVPIVQSRAVASPALLGFIRPWLLLPDGMVERFTPQELRFVFLHELAHLKRRDIAVNWLMTILQILHWFNPLVWFAFSRMRADRELACDELALSFAKVGENKSYGQAIIKLLEGFTRPAVLPGLVGILEDKQQMKRRIIMIAQFKNMTQRPAVAFALLLTLGLVTLTDAQTGKTTLEQSAKPGADPGHGMALKILLSGSGNDSQGVLSPDETKVAYVDWGEKSGDLMVKDLRTGKIRRVTNADTSSPKNYEFASGAGVWSPDSKSLAFFWFSAADDGYDLRVASADGGGVRVLKAYNPQISYYPHDWSSDGKLLLVDLFHFKNDKTHALATVSVETGEVRQLISLDWNGANHPRFSPDGRFVVFDRTADGNRDVYLLEVGGTRLVRLTDSPAEDGSPVFSPDGNMVLFSSNRGGTWHLWGIELKDGKALDEPMLIKPDFGDHAKSLTRNGRIAFSQHYQESNAYSIDVNRSNGRMDGRPQPLPKSANGPSQSPVWSPDGKQLAYIRNANQLIIQTVANGREEIVPTGMGKYINKIYWSPDGKWIALSPNGPKGKYGVHAYNLQTRELRVVYLVTGSQWSKGWSQDGTEFFSKHDEKFEANNLATGATRELFAEAPEPILEFDLSPDQKQLVSVTKKDGSDERVLAVTDRKFQNKRVLKTFVTGDGQPQWPHWSPDGSMIAYYERGREIELWVTAADGTWEAKVPRGKLTHFGNLKPPEWSPDSTKLGMTLEGPGRGEIGVLENFLPKDKSTAAHEAKGAAKADEGPKVRTLFATGNEALGVVSPDESKIAYTDWGDFSDLVVRDMKTGKVTRLTKARKKIWPEAIEQRERYEYAANPVWSPDAKWIAYNWAVWTNNSGSQTHLKLAAADGSEIKMIQDPTAEILCEPLDWSPDAKSLLCELTKKQDRSTALGIVSIATGEVRQLISLKWNHAGHPRFSPDGKFIAFDRTANGNRDVDLLALEGMQITRLIDSPAEEGGPVWSPDGKYVLFSSNRRGPWDLLAVEVRDGTATDAPFTVKSDFGDYNKRMSPSGRLAFRATSGGSDVYFVNLNPATGETLGPPKLITKSSYGTHSRPAWSPDGKEIAYVQEREGTRGLVCVQSLKDGHEECFDTTVRTINAVFWAPDGRSFVLNGYLKNAEYGLGVFSREGREFKRVAQGLFYAHGFSHDGNEFVVSKTDTSGERVAISLETGKERKLALPQQINLVSYRISPDESQIAFVEKDLPNKVRTLVVADINLKERKTLARAAEPGSISDPRWSPDGTKIAYNYVPQGGEAEVQITAADGTWERKVRTGTLTGWGPDWSSDGSKLALTLVEKRSTALAVLENFLPKTKLAARQ